MQVRVEKSGPVTTIVLNRPEVRNAVDRATAAALADAFRELERDETALVGVLYGDHGHFCAGADLKAIAEGRPNRAEPDGDAPLGISRMFLTKPVIAAIAGHAVAGGLELALWCDLRIVEEDAVLGIFNRRWGVPLLDGGTVRLPRLIGLGRALDLILTGRPGRRQSGWLETWRSSPRRRCAPTAYQRGNNSACHLAKRLATNIAEASERPPRRSRALVGSHAAPVDTGRSMIRLRSKQPLAWNPESATNARPL